MEWLTLICLIGWVGSITAYGGYGANPPGPPKEYDCVMGNEKVCGTNGFENFLFDNVCALNDFNGKELRAGHLILQKINLQFCFPPPSYKNPQTYCPQYCNLVNQPVCGTYLNVQRNFTNECEMKRYMCQRNENWQLVSNTTCVPPPCGPDAQQICAMYNSHMQEFNSVDILYDDIRNTGRNWVILNIGQCPCPMDYQPICAKVNCTTQTYLNKCFFERAIQNATYWSILFYGECPLIPTPCNATAEDIVIVSSTVSPNETTTASPTTITPPTLPTLPPDSTPPPGSIPDPTDVIPGVIPPLVAEAVCNVTAAIIRNRPVYIVKNNRIIPYGKPNYYSLDYSSYDSSPKYEEPYSSAIVPYSPPSYSGAYGQEVPADYKPMPPYTDDYNKPPPSYDGSYKKPTHPPSYELEPYVPAVKSYSPSYKPTYPKPPPDLYPSHYNATPPVVVAIPYPPKNPKPSYEKPYMPETKPYSVSYDASYKKPSPAQYPASETYKKPAPAPYPTSHGKAYNKPDPLYPASETYKKPAPAPAPYPTSPSSPDPKPLPPNYGGSYKKASPTPPPPSHYNAIYKEPPPIDYPPKHSAYKKPVEKPYTPAPETPAPEYYKPHKPTKPSYSPATYKPVTPAPHYSKPYETPKPYKADYLKTYPEDSEEVYDPKPVFKIVYAEPLYKTKPPHHSNCKPKPKPSPKCSKYEKSKVSVADDYDESPYDYLT